MVFVALLLIGVGYVIGSIPFGVYISKHFYQTDITQVGSKNPGATNVWRTLGPKPGAITLALDILKGTAAVLLSRLIAPGQYGLHIFVGMAAIIGHNWSFLLKGRGGKGVATSAGVFIALAPLHALIAIATFAVVFYFSRIVSVGSMSAAVVLMISAFAIPTILGLQIFMLVCAALVIYKHIPNMKRLARGEEPRVNF